jgi:hypothetical protein
MWHGSMRQSTAERAMKRLFIVQNNVWHVTECSSHCLITQPNQQGQHCTTCDALYSGYHNIRCNCFEGLHANMMSVQSVPCCKLPALTRAPVACF